MTSTVEAIVFDWAGTTVDYGCRAPMEVFAQIFEEQRIAITLEEIQRPMGMDKRDHIAELCKLQSVQQQWQALYGDVPNERDIDKLFARFEPLLFENLKQFSVPIPGVIETVAQLRKQGIKIGSTSGYTAEMLAVVAAEAKRYGYAPDLAVTSEKVGKGRPYPFMCYENAKQFCVKQMCQMVKVGDTVSDVQEGLNAGMWSVGVVLGSNLLGLSEEEVQAMEPAQLQSKVLATRKRFMEAGAHFVIDRIQELPALIEHINKLLAEGTTPQHIEAVINR